VFQLVSFRCFFALWQDFLSFKLAFDVFFPRVDGLFFTFMYSWICVSRGIHISDLQTVNENLLNKITTKHEPKKLGFAVGLSFTS